MSNQTIQPGKKLMGWMAFTLFVTALFGLVWAVLTPAKSPGLLFAYLAGLATSVTPCCLPIFIVITSLTTKHEYKKGLLVALFFAAGFLLIATLLGLLLALTGQFFNASLISQAVFVVMGAIAYLYAASEVLKFNLPTLGARFLPAISGKGDYSIAFTTGALLSAGDVGCPNPLRYVLVGFIVSSGDPVAGSSLGLFFGIGAVVPVVLVSLLALWGYNAAQALQTFGSRFERLINWVALPMGAFLIAYGLFGDSWYETSFIHNLWEGAINGFGLIEPHGDETSNIFAIFGNLIFLGLSALPLIVLLIRKLGLEQKS